MPKPNKSSASSGTRKKHARKSGKGGEEPIIETEPKAKRVKKGDRTKAIPQKKTYTPLVRPSAPRPDPLDTMNLASQLPAELVITLRRLGKKDTVTKRRALEELQTDLVDKAMPGGEEDGNIVAIAELIIPVWVSAVSAPRLMRTLRTCVVYSCITTQPWHCIHREGYAH